MIRNALRWLFTGSESTANPIRIIQWWEIRRIPYNIVVGLVGLISLAVTISIVEKCVLLAPGEDAVEPLAVVVAAFVANLMYTAGWIAELLLRAAHVRGRKVGSTLFAFGVILSILIVGVPGISWGVIFLKNGPPASNAPREMLIGSYTASHGLYSDGRFGDEVLDLKEDGTFRQTFSKGNLRANTGRWYIQRDSGTTKVYLDRWVDAMPESGVYTNRPTRENLSLSARRFGATVDLIRNLNAGCYYEK